MSKSTRKRPSTIHEAFRRLSPEASATARRDDLHVYGHKVKCLTDTRGYATPRNDPRVAIVVDASEGYIPVWAKNCTLRWRFQEQSMRGFADPTAAKARIRAVMGRALLAWGDAVPIKFAERKDAWDFEVVVREAEDCDINGCTLASAFFPDAGRHELEIYPTMLRESEKESGEHPRARVRARVRLASLLRKGAGGQVAERGVRPARRLFDHELRRQERADRGRPSGPQAPLSEGVVGPALRDQRHGDSPGETSALRLKRLPPASNEVLARSDPRGRR